MAMLSLKSLNDLASLPGPVNEKSRWDTLRHDFFWRVGVIP